MCVKKKGVLWHTFGHGRADFSPNQRGSASPPKALDVLPVPLGAFREGATNESSLVTNWSFAAQPSSGRQTGSLSALGVFL